MSQFDNYFELGVVVKPHGFKGELAILVDADQPRQYAKSKALYIEQRGQLVPFLVQKLSIPTERGYVKLEGVDTTEQALKLKGKTLYLPLDALPKLKPGQFYYHEIIGFPVIDDTQGPIGTLQDVWESTQQHLLQVISPKGVEVIVPMIEAIVYLVDLEAKEIKTRIPEGLVELYHELPKGKSAVDAETDDWNPDNTDED